jgi:hypothetical protein
MLADEKPSRRLMMAIVLKSTSVVLAPGVRTYSPF